MLKAYHVPRGFSPLCHYYVFENLNISLNRYFYSNVNGLTIVSAFDLDLSLHMHYPDIYTYSCRSLVDHSLLFFSAIPYITNLVQDLFISQLNYYSFPIDLSLKGLLVCLFAFLLEQV